MVSHAYCLECKKSVPCNKFNYEKAKCLECINKGGKKLI